MSDFSCRLKELRLENKLTQKQLAEKMNVSQTAIALWERGKREPDFYTLELLSNFFHVDVDYLLGRENNTYGHLYPSRRQEVADRLNQLIVK